MPKENQNSFINMLGLCIKPIESKEGYNGIIFDNDILVGYTKECEDGTILSINYDENTRIWLKDNHNGYYEGNIECTNSESTNKISYVYLSDQRTSNFISEQDIMLELSMDSIIVANDGKNKYYTSFNETLSLEDLKNIKEAMDYFYSLIPTLFTRIMSQYKDIFGAVLPEYKSREKKQPK